MQDTAQIYREYGSKLLAFIRVRVGSQHVAEDILQDVFLKALTRLESVNQPGSLRAWLYQVTRNTITDHFRSTRNHEELPDELSAAVEQRTDSQELARCFQPMIAALPETYREAVHMSEIQGIPLQQVAEAQGLSLSGAKSRVQRGRQKLKDMLLDCCRVELTKNGQIIDYSPRQSGDCCDRQ